ncbi:uncharacterized protein LOC127866692 [Dreissena polymorpha]|uniref:uncharacterized protein LOC127866692 n=1 Tax=Dreissena polymorpha TaxID=45954 RepID=UPI0022642E08|nr:uncharacterized protein LOC127866692 [Dreissena polymorpha]
MIVKGREFVADILFATLSMWLVVSEADCSAEAPVEYYEYILPNLPNTTYDFNDIVILPRDRDDATVTILNASGELIFDKTTVNIGSDFRLNVTDNNISYTELLAGLRMRTSIECDVVINLSGIPLHLVSTVQFETKHQLISDQQEILEKCMFVSALIQASKQDTVANICQFWARNATVDSNSDAVSRPMAMPLLPFMRLENRAGGT